MKNRINIFLITIVVFFLSCQSIFGQTKDQLRNSRNYLTWITPIDYSPEIRGYLTEIGDSLIVISDYGNHERQSIYIDNVKEIKVRKRVSAGSGIVYGALGGFTAGFIIGLAEGDEENCVSKQKIVCLNTSGESKALIGGLVLAIPGAVIGGIIGSAKMKIPLNGNTRNQKDELLKYKLSY